IQYNKKSFFEEHLPSINDNLDTIRRSKIQPLSNFAYSSTSFISTDAPRILIAGDLPELNDIFFSTLLQISANSSGHKSKIKSDRTNEAQSNLLFSNDAELKIHKLPQKLDKPFLASLEEEMGHTAAVFFLASAQDIETARTNRRQLKLLRDHFKGSFFVIIPKLTHEDPCLQIDCQYCQHKLSIDIDLSGSIGSCPICNTALTVPECLQYSANCLNLSPEVPCLFMSPASPEECAQVLELCFNSLLYSFDA
ncbi:MAG: hypothetical protein HRT88_22110, partial [Lentisphaeraceae bacterium]|nr:hypothetical protein [Lentisphaeraceae bacterium]